MSHVVSSLLRTALAAAFVLGVARGADDKPAPAAPASPPTENSIAGAKREFDVIKSSRDLESAQKGTLPRMSAPDFHPTPGSPAPWAPAKQSVGEKKSANWLVDAMEKKADSRKDRRGGKDERDEIREGRDSPSGVEREKSDQMDQLDGQERKPASGAVNPFARFLGEWMTPQDYALLKPGLETSQVGGAGAPGNILPSPFGTMATATLPGSDAAFGLGSIQVGGAAGVARVNPYLESLNLTPGSPAVALAPPVVVPPSAPAGVALVPVMGPPPIPATRSKIPEFAKPPTDEKYFKQLKRF